MTDLCTRFAYTVANRATDSSSAIYHPADKPELDRLEKFLSEHLDKQQYERFLDLVHCVDRLLKRIEQDFAQLDTLKIPSYMQNNFAGFYIDKSSHVPIIPLIFENAEGHMTFLDRAKLPVEQWPEAKKIALGIVCHEMGHLLDENKKLAISEESLSAIAQAREDARHVVNTFLSPDEMAGQLAQALMQEPEAVLDIYPDLPPFIGNNRLVCIEEIEKRTQMLCDLCQHWFDSDDFRRDDFLREGDDITDTFSQQYAPKQISDAYFFNLWDNKWVYGLEEENLNPISDLHFWASIKVHAERRGLIGVTNRIEERVENTFKDYAEIAVPLRAYYARVYDFFYLVHELYHLPEGVNALDSEFVSSLLENT